ncbi:AfsR/SARP family transcriptional regulator [Actinoplanes sp. M2I2]|uniref:AfsR/SARP family transcriptional regulator n=1 Tax=Actinoplanes sp. M2I2 TaxID=1734444 RepID=UPI002021BEB6|nr:AfsR/SARP family transcriptional regulator [Actinoplanes sp. M2I2]
MLFHVLGPIEVHVEGARTPITGKPATVLATLLLHRAWVSLDELADGVWPDAAAPPSAVANLRTYVWQVRRALPERGRVERRGDAYRLRAEPHEVDADRAARTAVEAARTADPATALSRVDEALGWWRGRAYPGLAAASAVADQLDELRIDLRELRAAQLLALDRGAEAVAELRQVTVASPLREGAWAGLVRALATTGRRTEALLAYRRAADLLAAELSVPPGPQLRAARQSVLSLVAV